MLAMPAFSHIALLVGAAPAGSTYKAVFQVGHGCQGSATTGIAVRIPAGFQGATAYPKAGWISSVRQEPSGEGGGQSVSVISWAAASPEAALKDTSAHDFILHGKLPETAGPLWFRVLQTCETGRMDWSEVPPPGASAKTLKSPAVLLEVTAPATMAPAAPARPGAPDHGGHQH